MERVHVIQALRGQFLPESFVKQWPMESALILYMTAPEAESRPSIPEVINRFRMSKDCANEVDVKTGDIEILAKDGDRDERCVKVCGGCECCTHWLVDKKVLEDRIMLLEKTLCEFRAKE